MTIWKKSDRMSRFVPYGDRWVVTLNLATLRLTLSRFVPYGDRWVVTKKLNIVISYMSFVPYGDRWVVTARKNRLKKP